jgi:hypothetical protein
MVAWKRKLIVLALLILGSSLGWGVSFHLWRTYAINGGDDPTMLFIVLGCMILPAMAGAWRHRELLPRLVAYPSILAGLAWRLRPLTSGRLPSPREFGSLSYRVDFYPSLVIAAAIVGGIVAVVFTRLVDDVQDPNGG